MPYEISLKKFRNAVNKIEDERDSTLIKVAYLLAARNSEILTKTNPHEILSNASKPYGAFLEYKFANYEVASATLEKKAAIEKVLVVTVAIAKKGKRLKGSKKNVETTLELKEEEVIEALMKFKQEKLLDRWQAGKVKLDPMLIQILLGRIQFRRVALPTSLTFEPWVMDCLRWIKKHGKLSFDLTRRRMIQILRQQLPTIMPPIDKKNPRNILRHWRITHLCEYYNFDAMQLTNLVGWSVASASRMQGIPASPSVDHYIHFRWQSYFPRLLKPLASLA